MEENNSLTSNEIKNILENKQILISKNTVINILHELKFEYKKPIIKPLLTDKQKTNRIEWCHKYKDYNWDNVKFTDESSIWIGLKNKRWIDTNCNDYDYTIKHPVKIHIWASISKNFTRSIFIFSEILTANKYLEILKNNLGTENNFVLQDDNDPKHRAKIIEKWKNDNNIKYLDWPSNSPDLNPIENIWAILKNKVRKLKSKTLNELRSNIIESWNNIDQQTIINTINSMPKRIKDVIDNNGGSIKY